MFKKLSEQSDLVLVLGVVGILFVLFTPIPAGLLDFLLITNVSVALLILLLTFYVDKPLQFSTFPSLLLIATLFRLSLNIASTRLILAEADAGQVIATIGSYVVGGNYVIGLIVFIVLIIVQYVVVTNGAQRVAEVAARFTLDGMPGKQMSIDADLNMGLITEQEAQDRRHKIEKEANFYGAMDGASKFVKGDAIAGILIVLINIIGGLTIGIAQMDMSWGAAMQTYTLLTVGDGIVTQIPALVISTGTGIIVTRASSDAFLSKEISKQITAYPKILLILLIGLSSAMFLPGIPVLPVFILVIIVALMFMAAVKTKRSEALDDDVSSVSVNDSDTGDDESLYNQLSVEALVLKIGQNLVPMFREDGSTVMEKVSAFRKQYAMDVGFVMPKLRVQDDKKMPPNAYEIWVYGVKVGHGELFSDRLLAINSGSAKPLELETIATKDPTYGLESHWIFKDGSVLAKQAGYTVVNPVNVLITHLSEIVKQQSSNLLSRAETERLIEGLRPENGGLIEELIPNIFTLGDIQKVLQSLLDEKVSIRNMQTILEVMADEGKKNKDLEYLTRCIREKLGGVICQSLLGSDGALRVLVLDPSVEQTLASGLRRDGEQVKLIIDPAVTEKIITKTAGHVEDMINANYKPVLLCAPELRQHLRRFTARLVPNLFVLSMNEVPNGVDVKSFALVQV